MKNILLSSLVLIGSTSAFAQYFPTIQRSLGIEQGVYTCDPCYTWAHPMLQYFETTYDSAFVWYTQEEGITGTSLPISTNLGDWLFDIAYVFPLGVEMYSPEMYINQYFMNRDTMTDSLFKYYSDSIINETNARPCLASPIFSVTAVDSDSMIVYTQTKFFRDTTGNYRVAVLLLQDSIYFEQAGAGYMYFMHRLTGPDYTIGYTSWSYQGNDSLCYTLSNGAIAANTIFNDTFHYKLKSSQVMSQMHPMVVVWLYDTVMYKYLYVNANDKPVGDSSLLRLPYNTPIPYHAVLEPNPSQGILTVSLSNIPADVALVVTDMSGRQVYHAKVKDGQSIDLTCTGNGWYTYSYYVGSQLIGSNKFIINKQ